MPAQVAAMRSITAAILLLSLLSHKNSGFPEGKPLGFDLDFTVYSKSPFLQMSKNLKEAKCVYMDHIAFNESL